MIKEIINKSLSNTVKSNNDNVVVKEADLIEYTKTIINMCSKIYADNINYQEVMLPSNFKRLLDKEFKEKN